MDFKITVSAIGNEPIYVKEVSSRKIMDSRTGLFHMSYDIRVSYKKKSEIFIFEDSRENYDKGMRYLDDDGLARALCDAFQSASLFLTLSVDEYCSKFSAFDANQCKKEYEKNGKIASKMKNLFDVDGFKMQEAWKEIFRAHGCFSFKGDVVFRRSIFG